MTEDTWQELFEETHLAGNIVLDTFDGEYLANILYPGIMLSRYYLVNEAH